MPASKGLVDPLRVDPLSPMTGPADDRHQNADPTYRHRAPAAVGDDHRPAGPSADGV